MITTPSKMIDRRIEELPTIRCGNFPTPLEEMKNLRAMLGINCPRLFIKRDDLTGPAFGSNKLRKLDYAIAAELEGGTKVIVTIGGERSNHARVTAAVCARLGLKCVLVLNRSKSDLSAGLTPASRHVYHLFGAETAWVESREDREAKAMEIVDSFTAKGTRASYLPLGVSFPLGAVGFVRAVRESRVQFEAFDCFPDSIFHASTSGGTQAGIIVGLRAERKDSQVTGVSPDDSSRDVCARVASIASGMTDYLDETVCAVSSDDVNVLDTYIGDGYGFETAASNEALLLAARSEGIILDHTYTAKAFAAMIDQIRGGRFNRDQSVLFWHTGGQLAPFYAAS